MAAMWLIFGFMLFGAFNRCQSRSNWIATWRSHSQVKIHDSNMTSRNYAKKRYFFLIIYRIRAYEAGDVEKGTVFEIPVTVVQPIMLDAKSNWQLNFDSVVCKPNTILRHFIMVPNNASWAGKSHTFSNII